jgi:pimeloyl-ACP methyl ester carboxylesterase
MSISKELGEEKRVKLPQGTIRYRETGSGEAIVFVHGVLVNGDLWRKVVPGLSDRFRCITPDLPLGGHQEPLNEEADLSPPGVAALLGDFIEALGLENVTIVANDTGGAISQMLVTTRPERIGRLVLTNCDAFEYFPPLLLKPLPLLSRIPGFMFVAAKTLNLPPSRALLMWSVAKQKIDREIQRSYLGPAASSAGVRRDLQKLIRNMSPRHTKAAAAKLGGFERPVLITWTREDVFFPWKIAERLVALFPDARLEEIEDSLIFVPEDQPERLVALMREFIDERPLPSPADAGAGNGTKEAVS